MSDRRRGESKEIKKDQQVRREVLDDIVNETSQEVMEARYRNPNRDQARGDWDRSRRHTDEGRSRDTGVAEEGVMGANGRGPEPGDEQ